MSEQRAEGVLFSPEAPSQILQKDLTWGNETEWNSWSLDHVQRQMDSLMHHLINEGVFDLSGGKENIHTQEAQKLLQIFEHLQHVYKQKLAEKQKIQTSKAEAQKSVSKISPLRDHLHKTQEIETPTFLFAGEMLTPGQVFHIEETVKLRTKGNEIITQDIQIVGLSEKGNLLIKDVHTGTQLAILESAWEKMRASIEVLTETDVKENIAAPESPREIPKIFSHIHIGDVFYARKRPIPISPDAFSEAFRVRGYTEDGLMQVEDLATGKIGFFDQNRWYNYLPFTEEEKLQEHTTKLPDSSARQEGGWVHLKNRQEAGLQSAEKFLATILPEGSDISAKKRNIEEAFFRQFGVKIKLDLKHGKVIAKGLSNHELGEWYATNPFFEAVATRLETLVQQQSSHKRVAGFWSTLQRDGARTAFQDLIHRPTGEKKSPLPNTTLQRLGKKHRIQTAALGLQALAGVAGSIPVSTADARPNTVSAAQNTVDAQVGDPQTRILALETQLQMIHDQIQKLQRTTLGQQTATNELLHREIAAVSDESGTTEQSDALFAETQAQKRTLDALQKEQAELQRELNELKENSPEGIQAKLNFLIDEYNEQKGDIARATGNVERARRGFDLTETKRKTGRLRPEEKQWTQQDIQLSELDLKEETRYQEKRKQEIEKLYAKAQETGVPENAQTMIDAYAILHEVPTTHEVAQKDMRTFLDRLHRLDDTPLPDQLPRRPSFAPGSIEEKRFEQEFEAKLFDDWAQQFVKMFASQTGESLRNLPLGDSLSLKTNEAGSQERLQVTYTKTGDHTYEVTFAREDGTELPTLSASLLEGHANSLTVTQLGSGEQRTFRKSGDSYTVTPSKKDPLEGPDVQKSDLTQFAQSVQDFAVVNPKGNIEIKPPEEFVFVPKNTPEKRLSTQEEIDKEIIQELGMRLATPFIEGAVGAHSKLGELDTRTGPNEMNVGDEVTEPYTAEGAIAGSMHIKKRDHGLYTVQVRDQDGKSLFENVEIKTAGTRIHIQFEDGNEVTFVKSVVKVPPEPHTIQLADGKRGVSLEPRHEALAVDPTAWYEGEYNHEQKEGRVHIGKEILEFVYGERLDSPDLLNSNSAGEDIAAMNPGDTYFLSWNNVNLKLHKLKGEKFEFEVYDTDGKPFPNMTGEMSLSQNGAVLRFRDGTGAAWNSHKTGEERVVSLDEVRDKRKEEKRNAKRLETVAPTPDELAIEWGEVALPSNIVDTFLRLQPGEVREVPTPDKKGRLSYERVSPDTMYVLETDSKGKKRREFEVIKKGEKIIVENLLQPGTGYILEVDESGDIGEVTSLARAQQKSKDKKWEAFLAEVGKSPLHLAADEILDTRTEEQKSLDKKREKIRIDNEINTLLTSKAHENTPVPINPEVESLIADTRQPDDSIERKDEPMEFPTIIVPDQEEKNAGAKERRAVSRARKRLQSALLHEDKGIAKRFEESEKIRAETEKDSVSELVGNLFYKEAPPKMTQEQVDTLIKALPTIETIDPEGFWGEMRILLKTSGLRDIGEYPGEEELQKRFQKPISQQPKQIEQIYRNLFPGG